MAKLFSHHDKFRVHGSSGFLCLIQLLLRWLLLLATGTGFLRAGSVSASIALLSVHVLAPLLSLQLVVPTRRNMVAPMIWPEFRMHSLIFSTRHAVSCALALALPRPLAAICQLAVVHAAMAAATLTSEQLGDKVLRTTSAMPYPTAATTAEVAMVKDAYAYAQLLATAQAMSGDADLGFMPLLAIQLAPFMMTLVRKGIARSETYHFVYSCALAVCALGMASASLRSAEAMHASVFTLACGMTARQLRFRLGLGKHATWLFAPALSWAFSITAVAAISSRVATVLAVAALLLVFACFQPPFLTGRWLRVAARDANKLKATQQAPRRPSTAGAIALMYQGIA